jgi:hypothetical protein
MNDSTTDKADKATMRVTQYTYGVLVSEFVFMLNTS